MLLLTDSAICFPKVQRVFRLVLLYNNWVKCRIFHWLLRGGGGGGGGLIGAYRRQIVCTTGQNLKKCVVFRIC